MRVRYLGVDIFDISDGVLRNKKGEISNLPDEDAKTLILDEMVEPFSYSIPDDEIQRLYNKQNEEFEFEDKVDILVEVLSGEIPELYIEANPTFLLEDGTILSFKVTPKLPSEWYYYNSSLSELYKKKYPIFYIEDFKNEFNKSLINYKYLEKRKEAEFEFIKNIINADDPEGQSYWYNQVIYGKVPTDKEEWEVFFSREIQYGLEVFLHAKAVAEYEGFLKTYHPKSKSNNKREEDLSITLADLFNSKANYRSIMDLLVSQGHCQEGTNRWKDHKKGSKSMVASLIKHLHSKGYLKYYPSNEKVQLIAINTFGIKFSIDTAKSVQGDSYKFDFIPSANTTIDTP